MSSGDDVEVRDTFIPENVQVVEKIVNTANGLKLSSEHFDMLQKLLDIAKKEVQNNPPGEGIKVGAACRDITDGDRVYMIQFIIELVPVNDKVNRH